MGKRAIVVLAMLLCVNLSGFWWLHHHLSNQTTSGAVRVVSALPTRAIDSTDRFTLVFGGECAPVGAIGVDLLEDPFEVDPPIAGRWQWSSADRLTYFLDDKLAPGRRYRLRVSDRFETLIGREYSGAESFEYRTRGLALEDMSAVRAADSGEVRITIRFNQPVASSDLKAALSVESRHGADLGPRVTTTGNLEIHEVVAKKPVGDRLNVSLESRLVGAGAELALGHSVNRVLTLTERFGLYGVYPRRPSMGRAPTVTLSFSARLDKDSPLPEVSIDPPVAGVRSSVWYTDLSLTGPFEPGQRYSVTVPAALRAANGASLSAPQVRTFTMPDYAPELSLPFSKGLLSPAGNLAIELRSVNVREVEFEAWRVYENNLGEFLHEKRAATTARPLLRQTAKIEAAENRVVPTQLDLRKILGSDARGIYSVRVRSDQISWRGPRALVRISDLGITVRQHECGAVAWVTSLATGEPAPDVIVSVRSYTNQELTVARTDSDGLARLAFRPGDPDGKPWLVIAEQDDDLNYLELGSDRWSPDIDLSGRAIPDHYDVYLYTERGVYRPGDDIHATAIVRTKNGATPQAFPVEFVLERPDGKRLRSQVCTPEADLGGFVHSRLGTTADGQTGTHRLSVRIPGDEAVLATLAVPVEPFVPARVEVTAQCAESVRNPELLEATVSARYLFGRPARGLSAVGRGRLIAEPFEPEQFPEYAFVNGRENQSTVLSESSTDLDDQGRGVLALALPTPKQIGVYRAELDVTVTEPGSRSITQRAEQRVFLGETFLGLRVDSAVRDEPISCRWVAIDSHEEPCEVTGLSVRITRLEREWDLRSVNGEYVWHRKTHETEVFAATNEDSATQGLFVADPLAAGSYRLSAHVSDAISSQLDFEVVDPMQAVVTEGRPDALGLAVGGERVAPGGDAKLAVTSPFTGSLLVTVEAAGVLTQEVRELTALASEIEVPIPAAARGSVFIFATVVRALETDAPEWSSHCARGMVRVPLHHTGQRLVAQLRAPERVEPGAKFRVEVETGTTERAIVHLWAVDEGILLVTNHATPNPFEHYFAWRRSEVDGSDVYSDLLPDHQAPSLLTYVGGGGEERASRRRDATVATPDRSEAIVWQRAFATDGPVSSVELTAPDGTGELRVMAVVAAGDQYGSAESRVVATSALAVEVHGPRFVAVGDRVEIPVHLSVADVDADGGAAVDVHVEVDGPVDWDSSTSQREVHLDDAGDGRVVVPIEAVGRGPIEIRVRGRHPKGVEASGRARFTSRPTLSRATHTRVVRFEAGELQTFAPHEGNGFQPEAAELTVGGSMSVELLPALDQLVEYPYGCVEQTSSRLLAVLAVLELEGVSEDRQSFYGDAVEAGVARLIDMQTLSGGLSYWPGSSEAQGWGSAYGHSALLAAQSRGHEVPAPVLERLARYLSRMKSPDDTTEASILLQLARAGTPDEARMERLEQRVTRRASAAGVLGVRAQLALAWFDAGRRDRASKLLTDEMLEQFVTRSKYTPQPRDWTWSPATELAHTLEALISLDPEHDWAPVVAAKLEALRTDGAWRNTLENAAAMGALVKYETTLTQGEFGGVVRASARAIEFDHTAQAHAAFKEPIRVTSAGTGAVFATVRTRGYREHVETSVDRGLRVRRTWLDADGRAVDPSQLRVGDLILVELRIDSLVGAVPNVAIVDALPACCEIENPRLASSARYPLGQGQAQGQGQAIGQGQENVNPDHLEFHDDRVLVFTDVEDAPRVFRYPLRVTSAGSFHVPPPQASAMYDPELESHGLSGKAMVTP